VSEPTGDEAALLRRLLAMAMAPPSPSIWDNPAKPMLQAAALAYLLLDRQPPDDAESFITTGLDNLVRELARSSVRSVVTDQRGLRGRVLWSATFAARADHGDSGATYVYYETRRQYDTPENQLLRFVVEQLYAGLKLIPPQLRSGQCYVPVGGMAERAPAAARLARIESALQRALFSVGLRATTLPARVEPHHILRAETARNEGYALASRVYKRYTELASPLGWRSALGRVGRRMIILPSESSPEATAWFELAAIALRGA
jgi:hypothetical protein